MRNKETSLTSFFCERWLEAAGEYIEVAADCDVGRELLKFLNANKIETVVLGGSPLTPAIGEALAGKVEILADFGRHEYDLETAKDLCGRTEAGISGMDALISETGTLVQAFRKSVDGMVSSLPPLHLVIAHEAPVFGSLEAFLSAAPSDIGFGFITGPSRTADIEKRLVLGAHGPKRVVVWGPEN